MGRYLSHPSYKKQGTNQRLISIQAKIKIGERNTVEGE